MSASSAEASPADTPASILAQALAWAAAGHRVALVTIVSAWSMAPRRAGAQMAVNELGVHAGSVVGGAVDEQVVTAALRTLDVTDDAHDGALKLIVDDDAANAVGVACGGGLEVRIESLADLSGDRLALLRETLAAITQRNSVVLCTRL